MKAISSNAIQSGPIGSRVLFAALLMLFTPLNLAMGAERYVTPSGSDSNPGTQQAPWASFQKAADSANPGDVIKITPGTYRPSASRSSGVMITRSGTRTAPITLQGEGGRPLLDCSNIVSSSEAYCFDLRADWWIIRAIDVTGSKQRRSSSLGLGVHLFKASNNIVENVRSYGHEGSGFEIGNGSVCNNNLILNCDSYDNYDPLTGSPSGSQGGNNADGFQGALLAGATGNVIDGARAWHNSDDGYDVFWAESVWTIRNSWAWANGYGVGGNGDGFKTGKNESGPRHKVHNCLAFNNKYNGFDSNGAAGAQDILNNTAYNNGYAGFYFDEAFPYYLRNNLDVGSPHRPLKPSVDDVFNSWNLAVTANSGDFISVEENLARAPRNADGTLPKNNLFRLASGSDLIDKGTNVGMPFSGSAADLGAFEANGTTVPSKPLNLRAESK